MLQYKIKMNYLRIVTIILLLLLSIEQTHLAVQIENPTQLDHQYQNIIKNSIYNNVDMGVMLYQIYPTYKRIYRKNAFQPLIPASIIKVLISSIAFNQLGPDHHFNTMIKTDGYQKNNYLYGNIYIQGYGAPNITVQELKNAVYQLKKLGIDTIKGHIYYDNHYFSTQKPKHNRIARYYDAPSSALTFNSNSVEFVMSDTIVPVLNPSPNISYIRYNYTNLNIDFTREIPGTPKIQWIPYPWGDDYHLSGVVGQSDFKNHYVKALVSRPGLYIATAFYDYCHESHISISGRIIAKKTPSKTKTLITMTSPPLSSFIKQLNQESNNVIAENLIQFLGKKKVNNNNNTLANGIDILNDYCIHTLKIKPLHFIIDDVTGLSLNNKFKANDFMKILRFIYKDPKRYQIIQNSLVQLGVTPDYQTPKPPNNITTYIKTGTLAYSGVNTMVGFIQKKNTNQQYAFVIMGNRKNKGPIAYKGTYTYPILNWFYTLI